VRKNKKGTKANPLLYPLLCKLAAASVNFPEKSAA